MELEPALRSSTPIDKWLDSSSEEPIRRRRRKRKRRPDTSSAEDLVEPERYGYPEERLRPYFDVDSSTEREISETTIRRKKLEPRPKRREENRPIRRRVQKRKRPSVETWPELSEFSDYRPSKASRDEDKPEVTGRIDSDSIVSEYTHFDGRDDNIREPFEQQSENYREYEETDLKSSDDQDTSYDRSPDDQKQHQISSLGTEKEDFDSVRPEMKEDKSLSEFTIEDMNSYQTPYTEEERKTTREKINDKSPGFFREMIKADDKGPINPLTLKDILKKSNGSSLSEILQQHNLSLADLLHGKEQAVSILKSEDTFENQQSTSSPPAEFMFIDKTSPEEKESSEGKLLLNSETKYDTDTVSEIPTTTKSMHNVQEDTKPEEVETTTSAKVEEAPKQANIRRFPAGIRRKQRIRPMMNNTYKSQLSRDMLALNARKYSLNYRRRNSTKDWKDHIPMMKKNITNNEDTIKTVEIETTTLTVVIEETTIAQDFENCTKAAEPENLQASSSDRVPEIRDEKFENETISEKGIEIPKLVVNDAEKPKVISTTLQPVNVSGLRRQAFNNRLKKKRLKQKNLTTEPPQDDIMLNLFGIPNLVSSSEFIERTQGPKTSLDDVTILDDFITTEVPRKYRNRTKSVRYSTPRSVTTSKFTLPPTTTEESAKIEIEEIFNDTQTSARLSRILMERNMTLSELVEHRERGSSHVHLADIFHNASKEPNPAEPFLSKSSIEPISKETYPLRALLDANLYDTTTKSSTIDPVPVQNTDVNIPVVMNFGNNVNENAESMGIMSLFHNITKNETDIDKSNIMKDSQGTPYQTSITIVNTTDVHNGSDTARESRVIHVLNDNQDDIVSWNEIFSLMRRNYANQTEEDVLGNGLIPAETIKKSSLEEDVDGDGLIVLEDLQHLNDLESKIASTSNENINFNTHERNDPTKPHGASDKASSRTKSVTIATASIAGLATILFLLTYVGYKWQQQRSMARRKSFSGERIPTPVFENRKGHKNNSSTRSISPMLSSSNIYTLNTLDSRNGKESPDYMWDSLRKPFQ